MSGFDESGEPLGRIGRYRLLRELGEGAMARVYLAELDALGGFKHKVALKVVRPDYARDEKFVKLLAREAMIGSRLQHPNVVQTLEFNEDAGRHFLALQFVEGETFAELLKKAEDEGDPGLTPVLAVESIIQVLKGLSYSHQLQDSDGTPFGIIHRDLKPGNIMLSRHGEVKVMDFGIAKAKVAEANITTVGQVRGTPIYMAPEQVTGKEMDGRTDQFAAATVLFELLTGEQVFVAANLVMIMQRVARADVADAPERADRIVPGVGRVLRRMWQKRPEDRYLHCDDAATDLETLLLGGATSQSRSSPAATAGAEARPRTRKKLKSQPKKTKEGGVLSFVTGLLNRKPPPPPPKKRRRKKRKEAAEASTGPIAPAADAAPSPPPASTGPEMIFQDSTFGGSSSLDLEPASGLMNDGPSAAQLEQDSVPTSPSLASIGPVAAPEPLLESASPTSSGPEDAEPRDHRELPTTADLSPLAELLQSDDSHDSYDSDVTDPPGRPVPPDLLSDLETSSGSQAVAAPTPRKSLFDPPTSEHFSISDADIAARPRPPAETLTPPVSAVEGSVSWSERPPGLKEKSESEEETAPMDDFFFGDFEE